MTGELKPTDQGPTIEGRRAILDRRLDYANSRKEQLLGRLEGIEGFIVAKQQELAELEQEPADVPVGS